MAMAPTLDSGDRPGYVRRVLTGPRLRMTNLEISNAAGDYLAQVIDRESACDTVRLVFGLAGLEPQPSAVLPGDTVFRHNGQTILVLDQTMNLMLADKTLDVEDTQQGPKLRLS